jgi:hypothetical protein
VWIHELLHIDWVSKAREYGSNPHVTDVKIRWQVSSDPQVPIFREVKTYGPEAVKALARWGQNTGSWVIRNSDNLTLYAMARYVQKALGNIYPHLPFSLRAPDEVGSLIMIDGLVTIDANGKGTPINLSAIDNLAFHSGDPCSLHDDATDNDESAFLTLSAGGFATKAQYPSDYLAQYDSWRTTKSSPTQVLRKTGVQPGRPVKPGTKLRILGVGDSITAGFLSDRDGGDGNGYRLELKTDLSRMTSACHLNYFIQLTRRKVTRSCSLEQRLAGVLCLATIS